MATFHASNAHPTNLTGLGWDLGDRIENPGARPREGVLVVQAGDFVVTDKDVTAFTFLELVDDGTADAARQAQATADAAAAAAAEAAVAAAAAAGDTQEGVAGAAAPGVTWTPPQDSQL